jgi:hypothetical protein
MTCLSTLPTPSANPGLYYTQAYAYLDVESVILTTEYEGVHQKSSKYANRSLLILGLVVLSALY